MTARGTLAIACENDILELKTQKLQELLKLKDTKIESLQGRLNQFHQSGV